MNRRILTAIITGAAIILSITGCNNQSKPNDNTNTAAADTAETQGSEPSKEVSLNSIVNAIKTAYGENYLPNMEMDSDMISSKFGLEADSYTEIYAETPMIGAHPDTLLIVKAADGRLDDVKAKLDAYREQLVSDTMQYPMNIAKINASQVVVKGDYAAFILLGAINENEDASDEEQESFAQEQENIGIEAFNKCFE